MVQHLTKYLPDGQPAGSDVQTPPVRPVSGTYLTYGQNIGGNYEIIERIGEGGMAVVFKAMQKSLNRHVAIKALHPKFALDRAFVHRFDAESAALAALSHGNIVTIIDRGNEGNVYYFVMEYVNGEDLDKKIIANTFRRLEDWRSVVIACRDALDYIHKRGVVHRDIKPSNILINQDGHVKIGDFGIAHIMSGDALVAGGAGSSGPVGTAYYMAPEQISAPESVDHRADIYSLSVAFYKMMTRHLPSGQFAAPSEVNRDIPVAVDEVIFTAMAPNRDDRYQNVREFCDEMLKALKDQTVSISSIFNFRSTDQMSSLYTGDDFKKTGGTAPSAPDNRKPGTDKLRSSSDSSTKRPITLADKNPTPTPAKASTPLPMVPAGPRTPLPLSGKGGMPMPEAPPVKSASAKLIVVFGVLGIMMVLGFVVAIIMSRGNNSAPPPEPPAVQNRPTVLTPAQEREERERQERLRREQELLEAQRATRVREDEGGETQR